MSRRVKPKVKHLSKKRKSQFKPKDDDWNFNLEDDDDIYVKALLPDPDDDEDYDPDFAEEGPPRKAFSLKRVMTGIDTTQTDKHGKRVLEIGIRAQREAVQLSEYLMEVISARQIIPAHYTLEDWGRYLHEVGHVPMYILQGDFDRYLMCIYAAEILRLAGDEGKEARDAGLKYLPKPKPTDLSVPQPELDGTQWGGVFAEDYPEGSPIREQIEAAQKAERERNKAQSVPAPVQTKDPYIERWRVAERIAREVPRINKDNPAHGWEGNLDYGFERMVKYAYDWIRDTGAFPEDQIPTDMQDLFWPKKFIGLCLKEKSIERREYVVPKVMKMIWKLKNSQTDIDFSYRSYRRILAAKELARAIEKYATNWKHYDVKGTGPNDITTMVLKTPDDECLGHVKSCVRAYVNAHRPIDKIDHPPGPLDTLDPPYVQYLEICRKYNIKEGTLLHEAEL